MAKIELDVVRVILEESLDYGIADLEGVELTDNNAVTHNRTLQAQYMRDLLKLADELQLASALVRQQYWRARAGGMEGITSSTLIPRGSA